MTLSHKLPVWLFAGLLAIGSVACSGTETETTDDASDATDAADASDATDASDPSTSEDCTTNGFTASGSSTAQSQEGYWRLVDTATDGASVVMVESYMSSPYNGPSTTGTYALNGTNYKDCGLCVLLYANCTDGQDCQTTYYAEAGNVNITALTLAEEGTVALGLEDMVFYEVTIDSQGDFTSTHVANGGTWCVDETLSGSFVDPNQPDLSGATAPEVAEAACVTDGNGAGVGANLKDFTMTNCNGDSINIHSLACSADVDAVWFVASADWCGPCHAYADTAKARLDNENQSGVVLIEVIGEDLSYNPATVETCRSYADQHGISYEHVFFDPGWQTLFENVWQYPTVSGSFSLPTISVAKGENLEYVYNSAFNGNAADTYWGETILNELAGVPGAADGGDTTDDGEGTDDSEDTGGDDAGTDG